MRSHAWIDRRSLALHRAVATKLEAQPLLLDVARANVERWLRTNPADALREWQRLLQSTPFAELLALLRSPEEHATRLRQSSPFAGVLSPEERLAILNADGFTRTMPAGGELMAREYSVVVERDIEGYYVASVPSLPGCHTQARSLDDLMERIKEAIELCLEVQGETGDPLDFVGVQRIRLAS